MKIFQNLMILMKMNLLLVWIERFVWEKVISLDILEVPSLPGASQLPTKTQSNKPEAVKNDGSSQSSVSKTAEQRINDDVTVDDEDEDDDDLMFDEEEFEAVKNAFFFLRWENIRLVKLDRQGSS